MGSQLKETMTENVLTAKVDDSLETAYAKLKQYNIRHLPVVDDFGKAVGIISDRDFQRAMFRDKYNKIPNEEKNFPLGAKVGSFMSWPVKYVSTQNTLLDVTQLMIENKISAVLVTKDKNELMGIISYEDLLRVLAEILSKKENTLLDRAQQFAYNSPVGQIAHMLGNIGI